MDRLSRKIKPYPNRPIKVVQFGEGNFLRAFVDPFIQTINEKGLFDGNVAVIQPMPFGRIRDLEQQDGLYTLILEGLENNKVVSESKIVDVISAFIDPYTEYQTYLELANSKDITTIISNTTEAGIAYLNESVNFNTTPVSFPGKLLAFLHMRFETFSGRMDKGLDIIACELIDDNGQTLKRVLIELARSNQMSETFINWMTTANRFYNTLVDRIVPGYPKQDAQKLEETWGYLDHSIVKGEIFHLWVIEGEKGLNERLPFDSAGLNVYFVDNLKPYKERKVKILNGSHTAMVPVAYLYGIDTVKESVNDVVVGKFIRNYIWNEIIPTIDLPKEEMNAFANAVLERYLNPFVRHELMSIALNSMSKYKSRILPSVLQRLSENQFPKLALFSLAALIVFYKGDRNGQKINLQDDQHFLDLYQSLWATKDSNLVVKEVLSLSHWDTKRLIKEDVLAYVQSCVSSILTKSMKEALKDLLEE
ncbi:MAG: tagaturonate reductase [Acholeplasma sp.]|nr:tagaturonate reductase [Acholeplasma sp.]